MKKIFKRIIKIIFPIWYRVLYDEKYREGYLSNIILTDSPIYLITVVVKEKRLRWMKYPDHENNQFRWKYIDEVDIHSALKK